MRTVALGLLSDDVMWAPKFANHIRERMPFYKDAMLYKVPLVHTLVLLVAFHVPRFSIPFGEGVVEVEGRPPRILYSKHRLCT